MTLRDRINGLPSTPGVYCVYDVEENAAYVGKTNSSLKSRLKQHFIRQDSSIASYGKLDLLDVFYVRYWEVSNPDIAEKELISHFEPYLNLGEFEQENFEAVNPDQHDGRLDIIGEEEAEFRREPYNRVKQKLEHLNKMLDKIKMADHTSSTQKLVYRHVEVMENNLNKFLDHDK